MDMLKFSKRCLQRTDAALQVSVWDVCQRLSKCFCKKSQNRCTLRLEFICKWKIATTMTHIQIMLKCQLVELRVLFFKFWIMSIMCAFTWYNCTWHLFHQSKLKAVAHLSSLSTWYSQADPGLQAPHHRCHPETPGGGPAPPRSCRERSAPSVRIIRTRWSPWTTWRSSCGSRGSWLRRGWGLWMERGDLLGRFTRALGPMFFCFCNCWINIEWIWMDYFHRSGKLLMQIS